MLNMLAQWKTAKKEFHSITGEKKPRQKGFVASAMGHSGIEEIIEKCDKAEKAINSEVKDMVKKKKLIAAGEKLIPLLEKMTQSYIKFLDEKAKDEEADKNEKTKYSKALKYLRDELKSFSKQYGSTIANYTIAMDQESTATDKAAKMVSSALDKCIAVAKAAIKKIKAKPTPEEFDRYFKQQNNIARTVQVQLVAAANGAKKGLLPDGLIVDPRFIADKLTPWQAGGKGLAVADPGWTDKQVLERTAEFNKLLKLAERYLIDLQEKAK